MNDVARQRVEGLYDELLAGIARRATEIGDRPIAVQWPHRGGAYGGTLIVGQSVYGWADEWFARDFATAEGRHDVIAQIRARNADRDDPMDWVATNSHRASPFWNVFQRLSEALEPESSAPWHARIAWSNIYPAGPDGPPGNPTGALREASDGVVGRLLPAVVEMLDPARVIVFGGPYWEPAGRDSGLDTKLALAQKPLMRVGVVDGRRWIVGWHPTGASYRGISPTLYAAMIASTIESL